MSLRPIVSKGYSQTRGSNIWRTEVQGGVPRQGRDTYFEPVPISVTLVVSSLGRQAFYSFLNNTDGGASSFIMPHDTGLGIEDHQVLITSDISDSTDDGKNWVITFTATAERTAIQEDTCLTKNLPDLFGCYGDGLGSFLKIYANYETTFPRIWSNEGPAGYPPINLLASTLDSRIVYDGPQVYYINRNGNLVQSAANEWPLTFIDGVAAGRVPPEYTSKNAILHNTDLADVVWTTTRMSITASPQTGMLVNGCFKLTPTTDNGSHFIQQYPVIGDSNGDLCTFSVIAKANGYSFLRIRIGNGAAFVADVTVNLDSGTIAGGAANSTIENLGGGWYRFSEKVAAASSYSDINMQVWVHNNSNSSTFAGDGVNGVLVCTPQSDSSGLSTSPVVTGASPVTRPTATAKVVMNGAASIDIAYSDGTVVNVQSVYGYATIPQADSAWGSKYITRIDFNVDG